MSNITVFSDLTTEEAISKIEEDAKKYDGLYVDMNNKAQRKYVKDSASSINDLLKKIERARIDKSKTYKLQVETEAGQIKLRLEAANSPFTALIDSYNDQRAAILAEEKRVEKEKLDAINFARDYDEAGQLNRLFDLEAKEAIQIKKDEDLAKIAHEKKIADDAGAAARELAAVEMIKQQEAAAALIIKNQQESEAREIASAQAVIDAENRAKDAAIASEIRAKDQEAKALLAQEAAVKAESDRQAAEKLAEDQATKAREANKENQRKINNECKQSFIDGGMTEECAKLAVKLLAKRVIQHAQINY